MKKKFWLIAVVLVLGLLAACGANDKDTKKEDKNASEEKSDELLQLNAKLEVPEKAEVNEKVTFKSTVTYGDDKVKDADAVKYEIWEDGKKDDSEMIDAVNNKDGTYTLEKNFEHDGNYTVQVHVDAKDQHTMPKASIVVGEGSHEHAEHGDHDHVDHEHGDDEFHTEGFDLHFMEPKDVKAGKETELMVHLTLNDKAFAKAEVRYEISKEDDEKKDWVNAKEEKTGEYTATHTFKDAGEYTIVIHVEDDKGLHEHAHVHVEVK